MPSQDAKRAAMSRRSLLQGAATAGAAGLAVTAMGAAAPALAATASGIGTAPAADQAHGHDTAAGPIMVHVRDARSGDIEVFAGTSQTRLRDKDLAARIARADRLTQPAVRRAPATGTPRPHLSQSSSRSRDGSSPVSSL